MKKIVIKIETKEDNEDIKNSFKTFLLDGLKTKEQLIEIIVEDIK